MTTPKTKPSGLIDDKQTTGGLTTTTNWGKEFNKRFTYLDENGDRYLLGGFDKKKGVSTDNIPAVKAFIRSLLAQQREEILDQVGKEMNKWWKDEGYWTCGANEAVEGVLEILSDKLSALRLSIKKKV